MTAAEFDTQRRDLAKEQIGLFFAGIGREVGLDVTVSTPATGAKVAKVEDLENVASSLANIINYTLSKKGPRY